MNTAFTLPTAGLKPSATLAINEYCQQLKTEGKDVIKLGFGQSPFPVPPSVVDALRDNAFQKDYLPVKGLMTLRAAVAAYYQRIYQLDCEAEQVLIGPGSKELLFLVQMIYDGDLVLPQPSWVSYAPQAQLASKRFHWLPTYAEDGYLLRPETLEAHCLAHTDRKQILMLNYPANPTGSTFDEKQLSELGAIAKAYDVLIISDEIYGDTHHQGAHQTIAQYHPSGTIISSGLSKWCGAGGWRLGTFLFPTELSALLNQMAVVASETFTSTSAPIQYAAIQAFEGGPDIEQYLRESRLVLSRVGQEVHRLLEEKKVGCPVPKGGFYLMPDFNHYRAFLNEKGISTSAELCRTLLEETSVALLPLSDFGMPNDFLGARLSYVDFDGTEALSLIAKDPTAKASDLAPKVIEGIQRLINWLP